MEGSIPMNALKMFFNCLQFFMEILKGYLNEFIVFYT